MTMTEKIRMTPLRTAALEAVRNGMVRYDAVTADWLTDGEPTEGWEWRTLSELHRQRLVWITRGGHAKLTKTGREALGIVSDGESEEAPEGV